MTIVKGWPRNFEPTRALEFGFEAEDSFAQIIDVYVQDDFTG